ncbi:MAG TPA: ATP-binding protein [Geobacteraceae bacterium]|nr:ATP-binding protein [Geobacteraceae bacterium]
MDKRKKPLLYVLSILALIPLCFFTGGWKSPARFLYFPLVIFLSSRMAPNSLFAAGTAFTVFIIVSAVAAKAAMPNMPVFLGEAASFFLTTMAAVFLSRTTLQERERYNNAISTFHALSDTLNYKNMNLQTALDALSEAHAKLKEYDANRTKFLSNVSHELRTPLSSIRSYSEILLNYDDIDSDTSREFVQIINGESERLSNLVNEMLDLIRIESGKMELNICPVSPAQLVEESGKVMKPMADDKGLSLFLDVRDDLPEVNADRNQIIQVLINLLNNAVKFTPEGSIRVGASREENFIRFFVADTGEGIFPEEKEAIFDEFYRISEVALNRPKGSGLGLSISKKIVEFHGGKIWVESVLGAGSTFYFTLPLVSKKEFFPAEQAYPVQSDANRTYRPILVIADDIAIRRALRKKLEDLGYRTIGADSPHRALQVIKGMKPGLIVLDFPDQQDDLPELLRWATSSRLQVLLVSLHICNFGEEPRLALHGYITCPFDKHQIFSLFDPLKNLGGCLAIISPDKEESRTLQVLLSSGGFDTVLFNACSPAISACSSSPPVGVIIGSFPKSGVEEIISSMKAVSRTKDIPLFRVIGASMNRCVKEISLEITRNKPVNDGLYKLIGEIELSYSKTRNSGFDHMMEK